MLTTHSIRSLVKTPGPSDLVGFERLHFIGAGGVGMSAVAQGAVQAGLTVTGSDLCRNPYTDLLMSRGVDVRMGHAADQVGNAEAVVVSSAIPGSNPELRFARTKGLPVFHRSELLAALLLRRESICVAGSHGKTTVAAMIGCALEAAGFDPTVFVGGIVRDFSGNARFGAGPYAVAEADESDGSFLRLPTDLVALTNIECEHLDYWGDEEHLLTGFRRFLKGIRPGGYAVVNGDDPGIRKVLSGLAVPVLISSVQTELANFSARHIELGLFGSSFEFLYESLPLGRVELSVPGIHNVSNATLAIGLVLGLGGDFDLIADGLSRFRGIGRRFQLVGEAGGALILDDYAHHPTEVEVTLSAARRLADARGGRLFVVFQPHRYTRTRCFHDRFGAVLSVGDGVVVTEIYSGGESPIEGVSGSLVAESIARTGHANVVFAPKVEQAAAYCTPRLEAGDVLITLGAGDVFKAGERVLQNLSGRTSPHSPVPAVPVVPSPVPEVPSC